MRVTDDIDPLDVWAIKWFSDITSCLCKTAVGQFHDALATKRMPQPSAFEPTALENQAPYAATVDGIKGALDAVSYRLTQPAGVPGPFALTAEERALLEYLAQGCRSYGALPTREQTFVLCSALDRAVRTLGAATVDPLSEELRRDAEYTVRSEVQGAAQQRVAVELLRRCPKPAPAVKAAGQVLFDELCPGIRCTPEDEARYASAAAAVIAHAKESGAI